MPAEPWLDELSEDWGDPEDIGLHLESLRTPRKHMGDIDGLGHRKSMSVPVEERPMTSDSVIHYDENPDLDLDNCGTTQVKARKPTRANPDDEDFDFLPEWKRRLLRGDNPLAGGDLFSPIGLEKFFEPPAGKSVNAQIGDLSAKLKG
ncbi:hypothetical protein KEM55_002157, partial [Ascosphaera atra]